MTILSTTNWDAFKQELDGKHDQAIIANTAMRITLASEEPAESGESEGSDPAADA